jgi:hypothetical protein
MWWTPALELQAATAEIGHAHLRGFLQAHGVRNPPEQFVAARPQRGPEPERSPMTVAEMRAVFSPMKEVG